MIPVCELCKLEHERGTNAYEFCHHRGEGDTVCAKCGGPGGCDCLTVAARAFGESVALLSLAGWTPAEMLAQMFLDNEEIREALEAMEAA